MCSTRRLRKGLCACVFRLLQAPISVSRALQSRVCVAARTAVSFGQLQQDRSSRESVPHPRHVTSTGRSGLVWGYGALVVCCLPYPSHSLEVASISLPQEEQNEREAVLFAGVPGVTCLQRPVNTLTTRHAWFDVIAVTHVAQIFTTRTKRNEEGALRNHPLSFLLAMLYVCVCGVEGGVAPPRASIKEQNVRRNEFLPRMGYIHLTL